MFDKNSFKNAFRSWVENNPTATEEEALAFCQAQIPANVISQNFWLMEQSMQWFAWIQTQRTFLDDLSEDGQDELEFAPGARKAHAGLL